MTKNVGQKLKVLRQTQCLTQKFIADRLNISVPAYSKIETGGTDITFSKLLLITEIFGISVIDLLKIGEKDDDNEEFPDLKKQLANLNDAYNMQQKKIIELHEAIRAKKS